MCDKDGNSGFKRVTTIDPADEIGLLLWSRLFDISSVDLKRIVERVGQDPEAVREAIRRRKT